MIPAGWAPDKRCCYDDALPPAVPSIPGRHDIDMHFTAWRLREALRIHNETRSMSLHSLRAITSIIVCILGALSIARAQSSDAAAIVARARAERAARKAQSMSATVRTTTVINVLENASRFDVIRPQTIVSETYGAYYRDPIVGPRIRIVASRGTAPLSGVSRGPIENFSTLGDIVELGDDRIVILNTTLVSPLATDADEFYSFELVEERPDAETDVISVIPKIGRRPLFEGHLIIARGSRGSQAASAPGSIVAMTLRPSSTTDIPFLTDLTIAQTFSISGPTAGLPDSLGISGHGVVQFASFGLAETHVAFELASRLEDQRLGVAMPDSLRMQNERIVVRDDASSLPASFWASHGTLASEQVASIETSRATYVEQAHTLAFSFGGMIDYNRAGGATPTISAGAAYGPIAAGVSGGYSFGMERPIGEGTLALSMGSAASVIASVRGSVYSQIAVTTTGDRSYPRVMNTLVAATLHQDYYDFFRKDGWSAAAEAGYGKLRLGVTLEQSRQFSIDNNARWSLLTMASKEFPDNPPITDGEYTTLQSDLAFSRVAPFLKLTPIGDDDLRFSITGMRGERTGSDTTFGLLEALVSWSIPLIETGYNPITLTLLGAGGAGTESLPPQYQFRLRTSAATFGKPGGLVSPPKGLYGGTEYLALGAEINLTDLLWRSLRLPTVNGRGIELLIGGAAARYRQEHAVGYRGTGGEWYPEAGVGLSRIPLFITEIVYGRVDFRKGFGPLGRFGGNFTFVLPL
jgi:hypothetical protein